MSQENLDRYRRLVEAFARRDRDACLELLDPNVDWAPRSAELEGSSYTGHEGFRSWWETMFRLFSEYRDIEIAEARDLGEVTLGRVRVRGHGLGSGAPMEETHWHVVEWKMARWFVGLFEARLTRAKRPGSPRGSASDEELHRSAVPISRRVSRSA